MKKSLLLVLAMLMTSTLLFACGGKKGGKVMSLEFYSNPSTGFTWEYVVDGDAELYLDREDFKDTSEQGIVGAGGKKIFYFVATKEGKANMTFTYKRPWDGGDVAYDVVYEISVDKNMNISCSNKKKGVVDSGKELSDFPDPVFTNK